MVPSAFFAQKSAFSGIADSVALKSIRLENLADEVVTMGGDLTGFLPNPRIRAGALLESIADGSITQIMLSPNVTTRPSGPASGDLTGFYPDPLIAMGAVKTDRIFGSAVTNIKIRSKAITYDKLQDALGPIGTMITWNGTKWVETRLGDWEKGRVSDVKGIDGLYATHLIDADNFITTSVGIMDNGVTNSKIVDKAVTYNKLQNATGLAGTFLSWNGTTWIESSISDWEIDGVIGNEILNATPNGGLIRAGAGTSGSPYTIGVATNGITSGMLANKSVGLGKLENGSTLGQIIWWNGITNTWDFSIGGIPSDDDVLRWVDNGTTRQPEWSQDDAIIGNEVLDATLNQGLVRSGIGTNNNPYTLGINPNGNFTAGTITANLIGNATSSNTTVNFTGNLAGDVTGPMGATVIGANVIETGMILDGTILPADLSVGIYGIDISGNAATATLATNSTNFTGNLAGDVTGPMSATVIGANVIETGMILDGTILPADLSVGIYGIDISGNAATATLATNSTNFTGNLAGDVTGPMSATVIGANVIETGMILDGTILPADLSVGIYAIDISGNAATATSTSSFTGNLAGDVTGPMSATVIGANVIETGMIVDGTILPADLSYGLYAIDISGNAATATLATNATNFTGNLAGDVTGPMSATVIGANVIETGMILDGTILPADLSVGIYAIDISGNAATATSTSSFTGNLAGDVTGPMSATVIGANVIETGMILDGTILPADLSAGIYGIDISGNAATATSTSSFTGNLAGDVTGPMSATVIGANVIKTGMILDGTILPADLSAGTYAINISGNAATSTNSTNAVTAVNFTGSLAGDVSGLMGATIIGDNKIVSGMIVDGTIIPADLSAGTYAINISGNATTATNSTNAVTAVNFTGSLAGDVSGLMGATIIGDNKIVSGMIVDGTIIPADLSAGTYAINISGNAATATTATNLVGVGSTSNAVDLQTAEVAGSLPDANVDNNLTIDGGTINNTPIGTVTPSTAEFTSVEIANNSAIVPALLVSNSNLSDASIALQFGGGSIILKTVDAAGVADLSGYGYANIIKINTPPTSVPIGVEGQIIHIYNYAVGALTFAGISVTPTKIFTFIWIGGAVNAWIEVL